MPGKQLGACAGLEVIAKPSGERGLYFTDEILDVTFELHNSTKKRLRGEVTVFYGFGPSGLEGKTSETIGFDIEPDGRQEKKALRRLVGIQGNGVIGMSLPASGIEADAIASENERERVLKGPILLTNFFHTLYTFITMEREFHKRFYKRPEVLMEATRKLTKRVVVLTVVVCVLAALSITIALLQAFNIIPHQ